MCKAVVYIDDKVTALEMFDGYWEISPPASTRILFGPGQFKLLFPNFPSTDEINFGAEPLLVVTDAEIDGVEPRLDFETAGEGIADYCRKNGIPCIVFSNSDSVIDRCRKTGVSAVAKTAGLFELMNKIRNLIKANHS